MADLTDFQRQLLVALVEGYEARAGMKDRIRALNEWEIARRSGYTDISYAQFAEHPSRDVVMEALVALQRFGLVTIWERGVKYDTFLPTAHGTTAASRGSREQATEDSEVLTANGQAHPGSSDPSVPYTLSPAISTDPVIERLDEIIRLLRSLDAKLGGP